MSLSQTGIWTEGSINERILPNGYTELEYIETTGTQYIDTTIQPFNKYSHEIVIDFEPTEFYNYNQLFGSTYDADAFESWIYNTGSFAARYNSVRYGTDNTMIINTRCTIDLIKNNTTLFKYVNGEFYGSETCSTSTVSNANLTLFRSGTDYSKIKIYNVKIYINEILVSNLIPALRNFDEVIGLYDIVTKDFLINSGTGDFKYKIKKVPSDYIRLEYVESNGTQYINTGIKGNAKHYYKLAWLKEGVTRQLMGYGGSNKEYWGLQNKNTGRIELGGAASFLPSIDITQPQEYEWDYHYANSINRIYLNNSLILENIPNPDVTNTTIKFLNIYANLNTYPCNVKIYSYIIKDWEDNILAQYIPVKRKSDNKIGLYETVSATFQLSGNNNEFIAGPIIENAETANVKIFKDKYIEANNFIEI